jgi:hypothetical protein
LDCRARPVADDTTEQHKFFGGITGYHSVLVAGKIFKESIDIIGTPGNGVSQKIADIVGQF